jgi:hypothetical protein
MAGESIIIMGMILLGAVAVIIASKKPRRELTASERMAYESERGRLIAQQEFSNKRNAWQPNWGRP